MTFILSAQLTLQPPKNIKAVRQQIKNELKGLSVDVGINVPRNAAIQIAGVAKQINSVKKQADAATGSVEDFAESLANVVKRFGTFTVATTAFFTLIKAIKEGVSEAIIFDTTLTKIRQAAGLSVQSLKPLTDQIDKLSTGLGVSSLKLADVSRILVQAGLSAKDTRIALDALAKTELTASFDDINNTTEGAIAIFQQFGKEAKDLESILSSVNTVAAKYAVESEDIVTAIRRAGGSFQAAGGDINELIGLFTSVRATTRASAESIATGFRTIFARIQRNRTADFLKTFGVNLRFTEEEAAKFGKTANTFVGSYKAIERLSYALNQLESTDPKFAEIIEELGGYRQIDKVIPLIKQFSTAQEAYNLAVRSTNSLNEDAAKGQDALAVQFAKLREEYVKLIRDLSNDAVIRKFIDVFLSLASSIKDVISSVKELAPTLGLLGTALSAQSAIPFLKSFSSQFVKQGSFGNNQTKSGGNFGSVGSLANTATTNPVGLSAAIIALSSTTKGVTNIFGDLNDSTKELLGNITKAAAQFGALTFILNNFGGIARLKDQAQLAAEKIAGFGAELDQLKLQNLAIANKEVSQQQKQAKASTRFSRADTAFNKVDTEIKTINKTIIDNAKAQIILNNNIKRAAELQSDYTKIISNKGVQQSDLSKGSQQLLQSKGITGVSATPILVELGRIQQNIQSIPKTILPQTKIQELRNRESSLSSKITPAKNKREDSQIQLRNENNALKKLEQQRADNEREQKLIEQSIVAQEKELEQRRVSIRQFEILNSVIAGASAAALTYSSVLKEKAQEELAGIRSGTSTNKSGAKSSFILGEALSGLGTGGAIGGVLGGTFGIKGAVIGSVLGGLATATYATIDAFGKFEKELASAEFGRDSERFNDLLQRFSSGRISAIQGSGSITRGASLLQNRLLSATDASGREDAIGRIDTAMGPFQEFVNQVATSVSTMDEFNKVVGSDFISFFTSFNRISIEDFNLSIEDAIRISKESLIVNQKLLDARRKEEDRIIFAVNISRSMEAAAISTEKFSGTINAISDLAEGKLSGANIKFNATEILPDLSKAVDLDFFGRELQRVSSAFGMAGDSLATESFQAAKAIQALPSILFKLRNADPFKESGTIINRLEEELLKLGDVPDFVISTILSRAQDEVGAEQKDTNLIGKLNSDFIGTLERLTSGISSITRPLADATGILETQLNQYFQQLEKRRSLEEKSIQSQEKYLNIFEQEIRAFADISSTRPDFSSLRSLQTQGSAIRLGADADAVNNVTEITYRLYDAQQLALSIQNELNNSTNLTATDMANLGKYLVDTETRISRLNVALNDFANVTEKAKYIQEELSAVEKDRATKFDLAREATFSDPRERSKLGRTLDAARLAALTGSIESIPISLRKDVGSLLSRIGDTRLDSLGGLSGDEVIKVLVENNLVMREGFSRITDKGIEVVGLEGITRPGDREATLITELKTVFEEGKKAQEGLIALEEKNKNDFYKNLDISFTKFLTNFSSIFQKSIEASFAGRLAELDANIQKNQNLSGLARGLEGQTGLDLSTARNIIPELVKSRDQILKTEQGLSSLLSVSSFDKRSNGVFKEFPTRFKDLPDNTRIVDPTPLLRSVGFSVTESAKFKSDTDVNVATSALKSQISGFTDVQKRKSIIGLEGGPSRVTVTKSDALAAVNAVQNLLVKQFGNEASKSFSSDFQKERFASTVTDGRVNPLLLEDQLQSALKDFIDSQKTDVKLLRDKQSELINSNQKLIEAMNNPQFLLSVVDTLKQLPPNIQASMIEAQKSTAEFEKQKIIEAINSVRLPGMAYGGIVPGTGNRDSVPTMLMPGEFVLRKNAVQKIGVGNLNKMNNSPIQYKASGGLVTSNGQSSNGGSFVIGNIAQLDKAIQTFTSNVDKLATSFDNFPREIQLTGRHFVEVVFNGAQVFQSLRPEMMTMIEQTTRQAINKMLKDKFPEVGQL